MAVLSCRVFLNLWFGKPMVCVRVAFHESDGNHENDEYDEDNSDSYKQGVECWIRGNHGNHGNDENHGNPECKPRTPQTTGLEIPNHGQLPKSLPFPVSLSSPTPAASTPSGVSYLLPRILFLASSDPWVSNVGEFFWCLSNTGLRSDPAAQAHL